MGCRLNMAQEDDIFSIFSSLKEKNAHAALCTVVKTKGSTPRKAGAKMIVLLKDQQRILIGTIGGGALEYQIVLEAMTAFKMQTPMLVTKALGHDLGMCCGGEMSIFIEPIEQKATLVLFGAGHIGKIICRLAHEARFNIVVIDERGEFLAHSDLDNATAKIKDSPLFGCAQLSFDSNTFVVVVTHDHKLDQEAIEAVIEKPFCYLGLVGSMRKALMTKKRLQIKGIEERMIERIVCPAGLNISADTPFEIAISIVSQMIRIRNQRRDDTKTTSFDKICPPRRVD